MDNKNDVPYIVYESSVARMERITKRLVIALVISIMITFLSNMAWLHYFNQCDYVGESQYVDIDSADGIANYIGNNGDIVNGKDNSDNQEKSETAEEKK